MTQKELITKIKDTLAGNGNDFTQNEVETMFRTTFEVIEDAIVKGEEVSVYKFGKFSKRLVKAKEGVNPQTQEKIIIPEHYSPKFSFSKTIKDTVK
jgi:DNA-binding protein HU-beta